MMWAGHSGSDIIVEKMLYLGASDYHETLYSAASYGHVSIMKKMIKMGAKNYSSALAAAKVNCQDQNVIDLLEQYIH